MQHYYLTVRQFIRTLKNLDTILEKATRQAEARKFDVNNFCASRLFPDMLPFVAQIRIACDTAKGTAANLAGVEAPRHEDNETTMADLRGGSPSASPIWRRSAPPTSSAPSRTR